MPALAHIPRCDVCILVTSTTQTGKCCGSAITVDASVGSYERSGVYSSADGYRNRIEFRTLARRRHWKNSLGTRFAPPTGMQHELERSIVLFKLLRLSPSTTLESRRRLGNWIGSSILARHWHCKRSPDAIMPSKGRCASAPEGCALDKLAMLSTSHSCSLSAHTC